MDGQIPVETGQGAGDVDPSKLPGWGKVHAGLRLYRTAMIIVIAVTGAYFLGAITMLIAGSLGGVKTLAALFVAAMFVLGIVMLYAMASFAKVPAVTGAQGLVYGVIGTQIVGIALSLIGIARLASKGWEAGAQGGPLDLISMVVGLTGFYLLLAALGRTASFLGEPGAVMRVNQTRIWFSVTLGLLVLATVGLVAKVLALAFLFGVGAIGVGIYSLVLLFMALGLLIQAVAPLALHGR